MCSTESTFSADPRPLGIFPTEIYRSTTYEGVNIALAFIALYFENLADAQKLQWHVSNLNQRPTRGDAQPPVCSSGLWSQSRHPNMFFELLFHWCIYFILRPALSGEDEFVILLCPLALTFLIILLPGGVATQEMERNKLYELYPSYQMYKSTTPVLFPAKFLYTHLKSMAPHFASVACAELPLYDLRE